ncbi:MAG: hypothetical protein ABJA74_01270 [Lapillicoccus sp.]
MSITSTTLTRAAGVAAAVAGLLFIGVQINHPHLDAAFATTTEYAVRESVKIVMAFLALAGITGMYLRQVKQTGVLGLVGYLVFTVGYLILLSIQVVGVAVLPTLATTQPDYVNDVLTVATGGTATGDIGPMQTLNLVGGLTFVAGGFLFGIALFRANVLAGWAAAVLAVGTVATLARGVLPEVNFRLFAIPIGVALVGLGYSLWRDQRSAAASPTPNTIGSQLETAGAK